VSLTVIIIINAILAGAIVSVICGGHLWAVFADRSDQALPAPEVTPAAVAEPTLEEAVLAVEEPVIEVEQQELEPVLAAV
jgi:hypothetical protein